MIINSEWDKVLESVLESSEFVETMNLVNKEYCCKSIYPKYDDIFKVYRLCKLEDVKILILGQDPYHTPGMADGIAFSVKNEAGKMPPSLRNIFKELNSDLGIENKNTDLTSWVKQGIFLLNTSLTVVEGEANSHKNIGWKPLIELTVKKISENNENVVFMLWGKDASKFKNIIDDKKHTILESSHPSPLSASRGFLGCRHFSQAQQILNRNFDFRT